MGDPRVLGRVDGGGRTRLFRAWIAGIRLRLLAILRLLGTLGLWLDLTHAPRRLQRSLPCSEGPARPVGQRAIIDAAQRLLLHTEIDIDALDPITPEEVAQAITLPEGRLRLVRTLVTISLSGRDVTTAQAALVERFAQALGVVEDHALVNLCRLAERRVGLMMFDVNRRAFSGQAVRNAAEEEGLWNGLKGLAARVGLYEDEKGAARWEALADRPAGSVGRALFDY